MIEPGWYYADGDPVGTQRYWDGEMWVGQPVYEPAPAPAAATPPVNYAPPGPYGPAAGYPGRGGYPPIPPGPTFPQGTRTVAIVLSVLKAIPLAFAAIIFFWVLAVSNAIDDELSEFEEFDEFNFDGLLDVAAVFLGGLVLIGTLLLLFQFIGAIRKRPLMVLVPAAIMSLIDGGLAVLSWIGLAQSNTDGSVGSVFLITAVAAAQIYVAVTAARANSSSG